MDRKSTPHYTETQLAEKDRQELMGIISAQNRRIAELERNAESDPLTGLLHKTAAIDKARKFLGGEGKNGFHAVILADIDNFKGINDSRGHLFGDKVITRFASLLKTTLNEKNCIIGRAGGDEFFILMKNCMLSDVLIRTGQLRSELGKLCSSGGCGFVSCSLGVSCFPSDSRDLNVLYEYADRALYRSKDDGKNRCTVYDSSMGKHYL